MFFFVIFLLGFDTMFAMVESIASTCIENLNWSRQKSVNIVIGLLFTMSLPTVFGNGIYYFKLMDSYTCVIALMLVASVEVVSISWWYGAEKFYNRLERVTGNKTNRVFRFVQMYLNPVIVCFLTFKTLTGFTNVKYGDYSYPWWAHLFGWCVTLVSILCLFSYWIRDLFIRKECVEKSSIKINSVV